MVTIDNISDDSSQKISISLDDGTVVVLTLNYRPAIQRWTVDVVRTDSSEFEVNGLMICVHPNLLRQWRNLIPFGLACTTIDGVDPIDINDFVSGRATLYILGSDNVTAIESAIMGAL